MDETEQIKQKIRNWLTLENITGFMQFIFANNNLTKYYHVRVIICRIFNHGYTCGVKTIYIQAYKYVTWVLDYNSTHYLQLLHSALCWYPQYTNCPITSNKLESFIAQKRKKCCGYYPRHDEKLLKQFLNEKNVKLLCNDYFENVSNYSYCNNFMQAIVRMLSGYSIACFTYECGNQPTFYHEFFHYLKLHTLSDIHNIFIQFDRYCNFIYYHHLLILRKHVLLICEHVYENYEPTKSSHKILANEYIMMNILAF